MDDCPTICILNVGRDILGSHGGDPDAPPMGDRVIVTVALEPAEAHARAAHKIERDAAGGVTLAAENRPMADAIADKLVSDGFGAGE